jgi:2'-5' RNA ligase
VDAVESALIVPVPEAEPAVRRHRDVLDRAAGWGVPAHVTILYPFLPPDELTDEVLAVVRHVVAAVPTFDVTFWSVRWFGETVSWLDPSPPDPFRDLTLAIWARFPRTPPYRGEHGDDVTPHLTIGHDAPVKTLQAAADSVEKSLPIRATIHKLHLIVGSAAPNSWRTYDTFPLASS